MSRLSFYTYIYTASSTFFPAWDMFPLKKYAEHLEVLPVPEASAYRFIASLQLQSCQLTLVGDVFDLYTSTESRY